MNLQKNVSVRELWPSFNGECEEHSTPQALFICLDSAHQLSLTFVYPLCFQATVVLTSKHFAQRQPWRRCGAATHRSTAAVSNWSWMLPLSFWAPVTSAKPWGQSSPPLTGPWLPRGEPCLPSSGRCWPALSPWCWKLCSESSPMLRILTGTHTVRIFCFLPLDCWCLLLLPRRDTVYTTPTTYQNACSFLLY